MSNAVAVVTAEKAPFGVIPAYSSIVGDDMEARIALFSAVSTSALIDSVLNKEMEIQDVVMEPAEFVNERTGVLENSARITLITPSGESYRASSVPLYQDVVRMLAIVGEPHTWARPVKLVIGKDGTGTSKYFTIKSIK